MVRLTCITLALFALVKLEALAGDASLRTVRIIVDGLDPYSFDHLTGKFSMMHGEAIVKFDANKDGFTLENVEGTSNVEKHLSVYEWKGRNKLYAKAFRELAEIPPYRTGTTDVVIKLRTGVRKSDLFNDHIIAAIDKSFILGCHKDAESCEKDIDTLYAEHPNLNDSESNKSLAKAYDEKFKSNEIWARCGHDWRMTRESPDCQFTYSPDNAPDAELFLIFLQLAVKALTHAPKQ